MARRGISWAAIEPAVVMDFAFSLMASNQGRATMAPMPFKSVRRAMRQLFVWMCIVRSWFLVLGSSFFVLRYRRRTVGRRWRVELQIIGFKTQRRKGAEGKGF